MAEAREPTRTELRYPLGIPPEVRMREEKDVLRTENMRLRAEVERLRGVVEAAKEVVRDYANFDTWPPGGPSDVTGPLSSYKFCEDVPPPVVELWKCLSVLEARAALEGKDG